jgi:hypothetical protein
LKEERRLRVNENSLLRKIFGPKKDEVAGDWRKLHNKKLYDLYSSPNVLGDGDQIKKNEMGCACGTYGGEERCLGSYGRETRKKGTTWET